MGVKTMYILTVYRDGTVKRTIFKDEAEAIARMRKIIQHPEVIEATVSNLNDQTIKTTCATFQIRR